MNNRYAVVAMMFVMVDQSARRPPDIDEQRARLYRQITVIGCTSCKGDE